MITKTHRPLDLTRPSLTCRCGKTYGMTEDDARGIAAAMQERTGRREPLRFYQCHHGGWHWTRQIKWVERIECDCGESFLPAHPDAKYCSTRCVHRAKKIRKRNRPRATCHNPECGKRFITKPSSPDQKYCTAACKDRVNMIRYAARLTERTLHDQTGPTP